MSTKNNLIQLLQANNDTPVSGQSMADKLGVSRSAIWKAIQSLRQDGFCISGSTKTGYVLISEGNTLNEEIIRSRLKDKTIPLTILKDTDSTNRRAIEAALSGAEENTCVLAEHQTAGRGRLGRSFYSPAGEGLYLSMIIKPSFDISKSLSVTAASSVAVCKAIHKVSGLLPDIKWVNDIYIANKKVCGILTEAVTDFESGGISHIIIGIGVNCSTKEFPGDIAEIAGTVPGDFSRNTLAAEIINRLICEIQDLDSGGFIEYYKKRSMVIGRSINIIKAGKQISTAQALDIDPYGGLVVQYEDGENDILRTGEISIRIK